MFTTLGDLYIQATNRQSERLLSIVDRLLRKSMNITPAIVEAILFASIFDRFEGLSPFHVVVSLPEKAFSYLRMTVRQEEEASKGNGATKQRKEEKLKKAEAPTFGGHAAKEEKDRRKELVLNALNASRAKPLKSLRLQAVWDRFSSVLSLGPIARYDLESIVNAVVDGCEERGFIKETGIRAPPVHAFNLMQSSTALYNVVGPVASAASEDVVQRPLQPLTWQQLNSPKLSGKERKRSHTALVAGASADFAKRNMPRHARKKTRIAEA